MITSDLLFSGNYNFNFLYFVYLSMRKVVTSLLRTTIFVHSRYPLNQGSIQNCSYFATLKSDKNPN